MSVNAAFYADKTRLEGSKISNDPQSLAQVAKEFEGLYLQMLLKSMREAGKAFNSGMLKDDYTAQYQEMYHNQLASHIANNSEIGLASMITKQMGSYVKSQELMAQPHPQSQPQIVKNLSDVQIKTFTSFATPGEFVDKLTPEITEAAKELGVDPNVLMAQAALESGWGQYAQDSYNLFGIKADKLWQKTKTHVASKTTEFVNGVKTNVVDKFRRYAGYHESIKDYVHFIKSNPRYQIALQAAANPQEYVTELQRAGYSTDPQYANKIMKIYQKLEERI